jgi:hypothetical protein
MPQPAHQEASLDQSPERLDSHKQVCGAAFPGTFILHAAEWQPSPEQVEILRAIPGEQRLRPAERLYWSARKMKTAGVRAKHPDWPEERAGPKVRWIFLDART